MEPKKQIVVIKADGEVRELPSVPNLKQMQEIVGGYIEHVRVLDRVENGKFIYTSMFVNETGLIDRLPRNEKATGLYQRNIRAQYPNSSQPFKDADADYRKQVEASGAVLIDATSGIAGYSNDDPHIAGDVIFFEGYTCEEADEAMETAA